MFFFRKDTWHHAFNHSDDYLQVLEFFSPPPLQGTSGLYAKEKKLLKVNRLIGEKKIDEAQFELSKLGPEFYKNPEYLYLRGKIFYLKKLYYIAIDTLLIALEFEQNNKNYNLIAKIYDVLGNKELSKKLLNLHSRLMTANFLKDELSGIYRKNH